MSTTSLDSAPAQRLKPDAYMTLIAAVAAIAGGLYGYDTGIISGALPLIAREFSLDYRAQELVAAIILLGAVIGSLACTRLSASQGRRRAIMMISALYSVGVLAAACSPNVTCLALSRFVIGLAVGGSTQVVPTYIAELAEPDKRGRLVTYFNCAIGVGILLAAIVGVAGEHVFTWRWMIGVALVPSLLLLAGMSRLPRSPRWLVEHDRVRDARIELAKVRHTREQVREEIADMMEIAQQHHDEGGAHGWRALAQPWVRPALIAGLGVAAFTQLTGIEMMIYYTPTFLRDAGFGDSASLWAALGVALTYLTMTLLGKFSIDHLGRRALSLATLPFAAASLFVLGAVLHFHLAGHAQQWWVVACLIVFMVFNSGGIQVIGWLTGAEIYPLPIRDKAAGAHSAMLWGSNLILTGTALSMTRLLGVGGAMWIYGSLNVLAWIFIFFVMPETRGRSLEDIERALRDGSFTPRASA